MSKTLSQQTDTPLVKGRHGARTLGKFSADDAAKIELLPAPDKLSQKEVVIWNDLVCLAPIGFFGYAEIAALQYYCKVCVELEIINDKLVGQPATISTGDKGMVRVNPLFTAAEKLTATLRRLSMRLQIRELKVSKADTKAEQVQAVADNYLDNIKTGKSKRSGLVGIRVRESTFAH